MAYVPDSQDYILIRGVFLISSKNLNITTKFFDKSGTIICLRFSKSIFCGCFQSESLTKFNPFPHTKNLQQTTTTELSYYIEFKTLRQKEQL